MVRYSDKLQNLIGTVMCKIAAYEAPFKCDPICENPA